MSVATTDQAQEQAEPAAGDAPLSQGSYAVYATGDGGLHLVYRPAGAPEDQHMPIPAFVVGLAEKAAAGQNLGPLGFLLGGA